ncbi:MAG: hypothetical protein NTX49_02205 [Chlamydiae bacterium]|nr:hypothetical protein [Chlamydiota bacterium]
MKIKCLSNKKASLQADLSSENESYIQDSGYEFLDIGKEYNIYGMIIIHGKVCYYVCDRAHSLFPIARPADLFEIIDNRLSRYWVFGIIEGFEKYPLWIFPEWINEDYFQDNLTDGEAREVAVFKSYKELMDLEFPDSSISETAQIGDNEWLICPTCIDTWQYNDDRDALVRCLKCQKILNNPRYKNEYPSL